MVNKLNIDISIEEVPVLHFSRFTLDQRFGEHHTFELRINHDQVEGTNGITLAKSKDFIGKSLTAQFGLIECSGNIFTGIITKVEIAQTHGFQGDIVITGYSPDILIDRGPDLGSYLGKDLKTIIQQATNDTPQNDLDFQIKPAYTSAIDYIIQYRESDFDFIKRLSAEYHEWFYYDGSVLHFGKPDKEEQIALIYGRDLHSLQYGMQIAPLNYKKFAYHSQEDQLLSAQPAPASSSLSDLSHAISASNEVFSKRFNQPLNVRVNSQKEIDTFVNDEHKALVSGLVSISGHGDNPKVGLGKIVDISTSMRNGLDFQVQDFGKFIVTAVYHEIDGLGHYQNTFEGVAADSEKLPVGHVKKPEADMQLADVLDNDDPQGQGRVKVKFKWECQTNDPTEWLRVMSPNAGSGDTGANRGFHVIPEKGDQVVVAFEEGNIARPVILGSVFHGKSGDSKGFKNSNTKGMTSRRGSALTFDDLNHALNLGTNKANYVKVENGPGSITAESAQKIVIKTGKSSITLNQDGIIEIIGETITIQGKSAINANSGDKTGNGVNIGKFGVTSLDLEGKDKCVSTSDKITISSGTTIDTKSSGVHTITGSNVDIN
ncbi:type VI secretion system Vgr family protein [Pedobacter nutrimenti]|uniref:type VI secretion system Vgr family protein n=1 Tax=Pedobacter nutrimenti TaxID=1241337 RepID=UPI00292CC04E|nr:phage baseplate assembly protein V [Pedobacter nutrimenti]